MKKNLFLKLVLFICLATSIHLQTNAQTEKTFSRKVLFELFTGQSCTGCPGGHDVAEASMKGLEDKIVWVTHHAGYKADAFTTSEDSEYASFFNVIGAPNCMIDRTKNGNTLVMSPVTTSKELFEEYLNVPTYATVAISGEYNDKSKMLNITVSGEITKDLPKAKLNVFLIQSGFKAFQSGSDLGVEYIHNDFMRVSLTGNYGEDIILTDGKYIKNYSYTIPETIGQIICEASNMAIVAFIADYDTTDNNSCGVHNAEKLNLSDIGAGSSIGKGVNLSDVFINVVDRCIRVEGTYDRLDIFTPEGKNVKNTNLANGIYIIKITTPNKSISETVIVH